MLPFAAVYLVKSVTNGIFCRAQRISPEVIMCVTLQHEPLLKKKEICTAVLP